MCVCVCVCVCTRVRVCVWLARNWLSPCVVDFFFINKAKPNYIITNRAPRGVVANVLDCDIVESEFEHQSLIYVHFGILT